MDIKWKYKIDVRNVGVFSDIEETYNITIPKEIKNFITAANAATPSKYLFMAGDTERVLGAVLSYNSDDSDADTIFTALTAVPDRNLLPFGIDPFGNYICCRLKDQAVVFWDHETNAVSFVSDTLNSFLHSLY